MVIVLENKPFDYDDYFLRLGVEVLTKSLNSYLESNYPTDRHRMILESLYEDFPEFRRKLVVYRALKESSFPVSLRNKYVSGCSSFDDVNNFIRKRFDKGYKYILISKSSIDCFDLCAFVTFINKKYGKYLNERYQDEKEIVFRLRKGNDWFEIIKYHEFQIPRFSE